MPVRQTNLAWQWRLQTQKQSNLICVLLDLIAESVAGTGRILSDRATMEPLMRRPQQTNHPRIVSMAPSVTSILFGIGARRDVVGVSKWCKDVAPIGRLPQVGDCWKLDVSDVMKLRPTLLIGSVPFSAEAVAKLIAQPVAFLALNPRSLADIDANIRTLGRLTNRAAAAETLIARMRRTFDQIAKRAAHAGSRGRGSKPSRRHELAQHRPRVYCEAWPNPRISSPPWVAELVSIAGGDFVTAPGGRVSDEDVARANPDLIVLAWTATGDRADARRTLRNAAWQATPAIRNGRVVVMRDELLNTPGPPLMQGARTLFRAIRRSSGAQLQDSTPSIE